MYATKRANGKKNRLNIKNSKKLCPFLPATRAGQKAIAIQKNKTMTDHNVLIV